MIRRLTIPTMMMTSDKRKVMSNNQTIRERTVDNGESVDDFRRLYREQVERDEQHRRELIRERDRAQADAARARAYANRWKVVARNLAGRLRASEVR